MINTTESQRKGLISMFIYFICCLMLRKVNGSWDQSVSADRQCFSRSLELNTLFNEILVWLSRGRGWQNKRNNSQRNVSVAQSVQEDTAGGGQRERGWNWRGNNNMFITTHQQRNVCVCVWVCVCVCVIRNILMFPSVLQTTLQRRFVNEENTPTKSKTASQFLCVLQL